MNLVEIRAINIDNPIWVEDIRSFCIAVLGDFGKDNWSLSVVLCDNDFIRDLNLSYRDKPVPTDVLSFPQHDGQPESEQFTAGDIVISLEYMRKNAATFDSTEGDEMMRLLVHGLLHLNGMDHEENAVSGEMLDLQDRILQKFAGELRI